jgi:Ca-activated chloride channel homolog
MKTNLISALILSVAITGTCWAQGFIIPHGSFTPPALIHHDLNVSIKNQVALCQVKHVFKNENNVAIEGVFYFPIPRDASVSDFDMWVDGKRLRGEVLKRDEARKIYEEIVRKNIDPALLEYADNQFFRINLFPIPAGKERTIELHFNQVLSMNNDLVRFFYPLHGESTLGRTALGIPGERTFHLGNKNDTSESNQIFNIKIESEIPINSIYSPSHKLEIVNRTEHHAEISYEGARKPDEMDFLLYYSLSQDKLGATLMCHREHDGEGFFMLLISPPLHSDPSAAVPQDLVFVLDTSGSMEGEKLQQAKSALTYCINGMRDMDRFALITFSSTMKIFNDRFQSGKDARTEALEFIQNISAVGGTDIYSVLLKALSFQRNPHHTTCIIFITDGLPTVGEQDVTKIVQSVDKKSGTVRLFSFGVGYDVNTFLLDKIAQGSHGSSDYIAPNEDIEQNISVFFDKIKNPVLADVRLHIGNVKVEDVYPQELPDLFAGTQLTVVGRYKNSGSALITLTGRSDEREKSFQYEKEFQRDADNNFLPHLWASRKVAYLLDEIRNRGENDEMRTQVEKLCMEYGILSPYTSFLVQEDKLDMRPDQVHNVPGHIEHFPLDAFVIPRRAMEAKNSVGQAAVTVSKEMRRMREAEKMEEKDDRGILVIEGVTFYDRSGQWFDSRYQNEKMIEIKKGSTAFINLLLTFPELGKFMVLENVVIKFHDKFIHIGTKGFDDLTEAKIKEMFK